MEDKKEPANDLYRDDSVPGLLDLHRDDSVPGLLKELEAYLAGEDRHEQLMAAFDPQVREKYDAIRATRSGASSK
jgi:uncharacterized FlgJ-related protein